MLTGLSTLTTKALVKNLEINICGDIYPLELPGCRWVALKNYSDHIFMAKVNKNWKDLQRCPTFWLFWATLEEWSWATH